MKRSRSGNKPGGKSPARPDRQARRWRALDRTWRCPQTGCLLAYHRCFQRQAECECHCAAAAAAEHVGLLRRAKRPDHGEDPLLDEFLR